MVPADQDAPSTESLLSEINTGTAAEIIMALRYTNKPPGETYIPTLDDVLRGARGGDLSTLRRGDLVEVIGPSGSGKRSFILFLALTRVLPPSVAFDLPGPTPLSISIPLGGRSDYITIVHPSSHRSPILKLSKYLYKHIESHLLDALAINNRPRVITAVLETYIRVAVEECLRRVTIIRVKPRWKHLFLALKGLLDPPELVIPQTSLPTKRRSVYRDMVGGGEGRAGERLDMVFIDGFADPFWPERWRSEEKGHERKSESRIRGPEDISLKDVLGLIDSLRKEMGAVVVLTLQALWPHDGLYATHLQPPYPAPYSKDREESNTNETWPLNIQITLKGRVAPHQLPADMTLVDALRGKQGDKKGDPAAQLFEGVVRVPGGQGVAATSAGVKFDMHIGTIGVEVWTQE